MSNAERQARYQRKKTVDPEFRQKENKRIEVLRKRRHQEDIEMSRKKSRETSRRYREKKKNEKLNSQNKNPAFNSTQAYGKALKKVMQALPSSPSKATATIQGVAPSVGLALHKKMSLNMIGLWVKKLVKEF